MAGRIVKEISAAITAASNAGLITIASTTGFYEGGTGAMVNGGQPNVSIVIVDIVSATTMKVRIVPQTVFLSATTQASGPNYGYSDVSAYNGGTIIMHAQLVYNKNDAPLT